MVFVALVAFYPFKGTVVPLWRIQVVDASGNPISNMPVAQEWQNHSTEQEDHWDESITDEDGYVTFPERLERASLGQRMIVAVGNAPWIVHASWGPHSFILVLAGPDYLNDVASYHGSQPPPSRVVLRRKSEIPALKMH
jgi:hypothetical protein